MRSTDGGRTIKTALALLVVVSACCAGSTTLKNSVPATRTFFDVIKTDSCPTSAFLYTSSFTKTCSSLAYPSPIVKLNDKSDKQVLLCLGLHYVAGRICYLDSLKKLVRKVPSNSSEFDEQLKKMSSAADVKDRVCEMLQKPELHVVLNKTEVVPLNEVLGSDHRCNRFCFGNGDDIEPLCLVLAWINQLTVNMTVPIKMVKENGTVVTKSTEEQTPVHDGNKAPEKKSAPAQENPKILDAPTISKPLDNTVVKDAADPKNSSTATFVKDKSPPAASVGAKSIPNDNNAILSSPGNATTESQKDSIRSGIGGADNGDKDPKNTEDKPPETGNNNGPSSNENQMQRSDDELANDQLDGPNSDPLNTDFDNREKEMPNVPVEDSIEKNNLLHDGENLPDAQLENHQERSKEKMPILLRPNDDDEPHFFAYFMAISLLCIGGYVGYHNKQKILAIVLEGRRSKGGRGKRRPNTAGYRKLDCTLEEAVTSQCNSNVTHVIY